VLNQQFDAGSLSVLRLAVARHAAAAGLPAERVQDAVIAVHELAANAVFHGAGHGQVHQWTDGQQLHCQVSDPGRAGGSTARPAGRQSWPADYGHGLWLAGQAADRVIVNRARDGTNVTVSFAIDVA
jgi:anti-sigma regulatory factor (Ser/Thr protein kinase)